MRVIEEQMIQAIMTMRSNSSLVHDYTWELGNTAVRWSVDTVGDIAHASVYLNGNMIARVYRGLLTITLARWNTPLTRSRLTALCLAFTPDCYGVATKMGKVSIRYASGKANETIANNEWVNV